MLKYRFALIGKAVFFVCYPIPSFVVKFFIMDSDNIRNKGQFYMTGVIMSGYLDGRLFFLLNRRKSYNRKKKSPQCPP